MATVDNFIAIRDEMDRECLDVTLEGGGAACAFLQVKLDDGRVVLFGDVNENWGGDIYANEEAVSYADSCESRELSIPTTNVDPVAITSQFLITFGR